MKKADKRRRRKPNKWPRELVTDEWRAVVLSELERQGVSQADLVRLTGADKATISVMLHGEGKSTSVLVIPISQHLGIPYQSYIAPSEEHAEWYALGDRMSPEEVRSLIQAFHKVKGE